MQKQPSTTRGERKEESGIQIEKTCSRTAEKPEVMKLSSCSDGLNGDSADVELKENEDKRGLYTVTVLTVQRYEGETGDGQFHGEGVAYFEGGHVYQGMFSKGLMDGHGVFTRADGFKYEGDFVSNMPMGKGTYTWPDDSSYEGEVHNSIRHGTGTYNCPKTGVSYTGRWDHGKRHGKGAVFYNQDKTSWYKGDWVRNNREGWGVRCYPSGNIYSGEWKNNLRHGGGTMRWLNLDQQYEGMWQNGVQHGSGTHSWILRQEGGSHYFLSNQYTGGFVNGQRHGQGTMYYASGAVYEGGWSKDKSHGKGKFTSSDGRVFEGELMYDQLMTQTLNASRSPAPLRDMAVNIERLLDTMPARQREAEREQVVYEVLKHGAELRSIYTFYSGLGRVRSPSSFFQLTRLQLWRLLKDCNIHHHGITLTQTDLLIRDEATTADVHSPFTPIFLRQLISCFVFVAYYSYSKDMISQMNILASCFSKLMTDDVLPNARHVKGFLFRQQDCAVVAVNYLTQCWQIYKAFCKVSAAPGEDQTMTCRELLWMFKSLHLLDNNLTTRRLMEIITAERLDPTNLTSCLDVEITFLEFFEVLLGSAEVKCSQVSEGLQGHMLSGPDAEAGCDLTETEASESIMQTTNTGSQEVEKSSDMSEISTAQDVERRQEDKIKEKPLAAEHSKSHSEVIEGHGQDRQDMEARGTKVEGHKVERRIQMIHKFFNQVLFPAFERKQREET